MCYASQTFCVLFQCWCVMNKRSKEKNCNPTIKHIILYLSGAFPWYCWSIAAALQAFGTNLASGSINQFTTREGQGGNENGGMAKPCTWQWVSSLFFSYIVMGMFSLFRCFQKPFMPDKTKCQTWQLTSKHSMYTLLNSVSLDYKWFRAETLSCNCVTCAIHIYESIEELVIICDATDGFIGKWENKCKFCFATCTLPRKKILFQS